MRKQHYFTPISDLGGDVKAFVIKQQTDKVAMLRLSTPWDAAEMPLPASEDDVYEGLVMALAGRPIRMLGSSAAEPPWVEETDEDTLARGLPQRNPAWLAILRTWAQEIDNWVRGNPDEAVYR